MKYLRQFIKTTIREFLNENINNDISNIILTSNDWDGFIKAVRMQYGDIIPIYHATTIENSKIIDKEGFKLVQGKNYKSFSKDDILYFQLGKSDYVSTNRPVLYELEVPIEFLNYCDIDMDNVDISDSEISKYINLDLLEDLSSDIKDVIIYFIWNDLKLDGFELILHDRYFDDNEGIDFLFKNMRYNKIYESLNSSLIEEVTHAEFHSWKRSHKMIKDLDKVFDLFNDKFDLYEDEPYEDYYNTYKIRKDTLEIKLKKLKQDIFINSFDDEWFTIGQCFYHSFEDTDYDEVKYFICDSIEGVEEFLNRF